VNGGHDGFISTDLFQTLKIALRIVSETSGRVESISNLLATHTLVIQRMVQAHAGSRYKVCRQTANARISRCPSCFRRLLFLVFALLASFFSGVDFLLSRSDFQQRHPAASKSSFSSSCSIPNSDQQRSVTACI
jgi:hypothetical protein